MKVIPLNLTPRRKEVLWHAAYSTAEWSTTVFVNGERPPIHKIALGRMDVTGIVRLLRRRGLIKFDVVELSRRRCQIFIRITKLGMDVLLGNVACVDPKK